MNSPLDLDFPLVKRDELQMARACHASPKAKTLLENKSNLRYVSARLGTDIGCFLGPPGDGPETGSVVTTSSNYLRSLSTRWSSGHSVRKQVGEGLFAFHCPLCLICEETSKITERK